MNNSHPTKHKEASDHSACDAHLALPHGVRELRNRFSWGLHVEVDIEQVAVLDDIVFVFGAEEVLGFHFPFAAEAE